MRRFRTVFNAVKTHFRQVEKQVGIGGAQLWALSVVQARPGLGVGELALAMDIHQSTASNLVKSLVKAGLLRTHRGPEDRRAARLELGDAGAALLQQAPGPFAGVLPQALRSLDTATLLRLDQDLGALLVLLQADEHAQGLPLADM